MKTQKETIANHFKTRKTITHKQAADKYGIPRLSAVIFDLRGSVWDILTVMTSVKSRWEKSRIARYVLIKMPVDSKK
jgi:protein involved in ribonucleotide reduction